MLAVFVFTPLQNRVEWIDAEISARPLFLLSKIRWRLLSKASSGRFGKFRLNSDEFANLLILFDVFRGVWRCWWPQEPKLLIRWSQVRILHVLPSTRKETLLSEMKWGFLFFGSCSQYVAASPRFRVVSSVGRASALHAECRQFEPVTTHQTKAPSGNGAGLLFFLGASCSKPIGDGYVRPLENNIQHRAQNHLLGLTSTPPSGARGAWHLLQCLRLMDMICVTVAIDPL